MRLIAGRAGAVAGRAPRTQALGPRHPLVLACCFLFGLASARPAGAAPLAQSGASAPAQERLGLAIPPAPAEPDLAIRIEAPEPRPASPRIAGGRDGGPGAGTLVLLERSAGGWLPVDRAPLRCPEGIDRLSALPAREDRAWLDLRGPLAPHGRCLEVWRVRGRRLVPAPSHETDGPDESAWADLEGDGTPELILDADDDYVLCYACGLRHAARRAYRWQGEGFGPLAIAPLPESVPAPLRAPLNRSVALAQAGLWRQAAAVARSVPIPAAEPDARRLASLIRLNAEAREAAARESRYPLLAEVLAGDYAAAVAIMRPLGAEAIFSPDSPLVAGSAAESWEPRLADWTERSATAALALQPRLAEAQFLRGWARYLADPAGDAARRDLERAALLAPEEPLFAQSAELLSQRRRFMDRLRLRLGRGG